MTRKHIENLLWAVQIAACLVVFGLLRIEAPNWAINLSVCIAFAAGLPAAFLAIRRQWHGN